MRPRDPRLEVSSVRPEEATRKATSRIGPCARVDPEGVRRDGTHFQ